MKLSPQNGAAITYLVASAVDRLSAVLLLESYLASQGMERHSREEDTLA